MRETQLIRAGFCLNILVCHLHLFLRSSLPWLCAYERGGDFKINRGGPVGMWVCLFWCFQISTSLGKMALCTFKSVLDCSNCRIQEIFHPKLKIVSSITPSHSKPVWMCLFWTQRKMFWRKLVIRLFWDTIDFHSRRTILLCFPHSSEYLPLCSEQTNSYRVGPTWRWVNALLKKTIEAQ